MTVEQQIADAIHDVSKDPMAAERLRALFLQAHLAPATPNPLTLLIEQFGTGGAREVAESFVQRVLDPLARTAGQLARFTPAPPSANPLSN